LALLALAKSLLLAEEVAAAAATLLTALEVEVEQVDTTTMLLQFYLQEH
jgi:hypothetical protein